MCEQSKYDKLMFDAESALACCCDIVNTWCRESVAPECEDPCVHDVALRDAICELWSVLSDRTSQLRAENEKLRRLVRQAMNSQGPLSAAKWYANAAELLGRE